MKIAMIAAAALSLATAAMAQVQPNDNQADREVASARQAHLTALKSGNAAEIAKTEASLKHAYEVDAVDHQENAAYAKLPKAGEPRAAALALLQAQDSARDAKLSGNVEEIKRSKAELKVAYARNWQATHSKKAVH